MLRDFRLQFPIKPLSIPIGPFRIFSKIRGDFHSSRCTTGVVDIGGKWKKSYVWTLFGSTVESTYTVDKFVPSSSLSGISSQILFPLCNCLHLKVNLKEKVYLYFSRYRWHRCKTYNWCSRYRWCECLREFPKKIWNGPNYDDSWENLKQQISWQCSF